MDSGALKLHLLPWKMRSRGLENLPLVTDSSVGLCELDTHDSPGDWPLSPTPRTGVAVAATLELETPSPQRAHESRGGRRQPWAEGAPVHLRAVQTMQTLAAGEPRGPDALRSFQGLLLDRRGRLHGELLRLREVARRLERFRRRSQAANVAGSSLSAAGAVAAIVGLSLSPVTLGASLLASALGLGVATAGGAVTITSDVSLIFCNSRELRKVQEIAATCQDQMREMLSCLDYFCRCQGHGDVQLLQSGRSASMALYNCVYFIVFFSSRGFLVPRRAEGATRVSQAVLKAKIQKLAESLESCTGALDELSEQLEARVRLCTKAGLSHDLRSPDAPPAALLF
ncbi:apolipoprotein L domain-containing protein 1-like [Ochotona curzoniae]|uniref:apolipoprotein L domain-containing protein 1-like n=1 Tax=Ochotona curzoniae TaxID=130825 RepID=UPI001B350B86|nr:apolipoprotein L domain-containing protein 1-like [Ochotona curzoniae]